MKIPEQRILLISSLTTSPQKMIKKHKHTEMNTFEHFPAFVFFFLSQILFSNSKLQFCLVVLYFGEKPHNSYSVN